MIEQITIGMRVPEEAFRFVFSKLSSFMGLVYPRHQAMFESPPDWITEEVYCLVCPQESDLTGSEIADLNEILSLYIKRCMILWEEQKAVFPPPSEDAIIPA